MTPTLPTSAPTGATVIDALSLLAEVADDLVVKTVRDTHMAVLGRVGRLGLQSPVQGGLHRGIAGAVYGSIGAGFRGASKGLDKIAATGVGPKVEDSPHGRLVTAAVNGIIGDKLLRERPQMAIPMAVRRHGRDVEPVQSRLIEEFPEASGHLVVFLHGLCESEASWGIHRDRTGTTYAEMLAGRGWTPLMLRANTGLPLRENGAGLAALMQRLVDEWPVEVTRIALVGHSLGGLVFRAASDIVSSIDPPWSQLVTDVVTLGTPHLGAPIAIGVGHGSRGLGRLPETAAFGRILDLRSRGVHDLVVGLTEDVPPLPHARYHLVAATVTRDRHHPVGDMVGDLLVRPESAYGRDRSGRTLFPDADVLHVGGTDHFGLLNHPDVHRALQEWLR